MGTGSVIEGNHRPLVPAHPKYLVHSSPIDELRDKGWGVNDGRGGGEGGSRMCDTKYSKVWS